MTRVVFPVKSTAGVVTLSFFFVFLAVAFTLDKSFSSVEDTDVVEVHRQLLGTPKKPTFVRLIDNFFICLSKLLGVRSEDLISLGIELPQLQPL